MQSTIDTRPQQTKQAIRSALCSGLWMILSAAALLFLRARFVPTGIGSVILALSAAFDVLMLVPLAITLKNRLQEIQGGEEDEARNY